MSCVVFVNDTTTTEIYTYGHPLSLHDALPISLWEVGTRLMRADSPRAWNALTNAANMLRDNRSAFEKCQRVAAKARKPVRYATDVAPDFQPGQASHFPAQPDRGSIDRKSTRLNSSH